LLLLIVALPAVAVSWKTVSPPNAPKTVAPLLVIVALPAVEVTKKSVSPPDAPLSVPPLLVKAVMLPAVALLVNTMAPRLPVPELLTAVTKFWVIPELFVMPTPLIVSVKAGAAVMVKALAPEAKLIAATCVLAVMETLVMLEVSNIAVSEGPLGTAGDQLAALFQFPLTAFACHSARVAKVIALLRADVRNNNAAAATKKWRKGEYREMPMIRRGLAVWGFIVF